MPPSSSSFLNDILDIQAVRMSVEPARDNEAVDVCRVSEGELRSL
jgi:hypothetical protein